jgi:hypothetical protein
MSLPIVIIHVNNSEYLSYSLAQAKKSNPESNIVLLGDSSNDCYKFIEHENIFNYYKMLKILVIYIDTIVLIHTTMSYFVFKGGFF